MDRIAALRNVEDALAAFERGERDLASTEERVQAVLRSYATEYEDGATAVYRVEPVDGRPAVLVAAGPAEARERAAELVDADCQHADVERLSEPE